MAHCGVLAAAKVRSSFIWHVPFAGGLGKMSMGKHSLWLAVVFAGIVSLASLAVGEDVAKPPDGFRELFDLHDPSTWKGGATRDPREIAALRGDELVAWQREMQQGLTKHWRVEKDEHGGYEIVSDGHAPHLATARDYGDFELWVDWKINPDGDSGIYLRGVPQVQIWDPWSQISAKHGAAKGSGGLWNNTTHERFPTVRADRRPGEWNRMHVIMIGPYVTVELNDQKVVDNVVMENYYNRSIPVFARGPISLQTHGNETRFRNLFIREIGGEEANRRLAEIEGGDAAFNSLFDGQSFTGWIGATANYQIVDGAIQCKPGRGGNLLTAENYGDFVLRFEFRLPPRGNNGLAIRTPHPNSHPSTDGIELQVLDNTSPRYARLHDYQFHGSAYGLAPAHRGYLRPVGQWNYEQVTARGDRIEVDLNGFQILSVNLADVREHPLDGKAHPGAFRTTGHLGFCGHSDPVAFRNIRVKRLKD